MAKKKDKTETKKAEDMPEQASAPSASGDAPPAPSLNILAQYVKDMSFENPQAPKAAPKDSKANIEVRIDVNAEKIADDDHEVSLHFKVESKSEQHTAFIAELHYAAVFRLQNVPEADMNPVLFIEGPRQIFPFARQILASMTRDGGFPPLYLDPINFAALYQQNMQRMQQNEMEKIAKTANGEGSEGELPADLIAPTDKPI